MSSPHGLAGQFGYKSETTVGTGVTVDKFLPITSESVKANRERLESNGVRAGRLTRQYWKAGKTTINGSIALDLWNLDVGTLLLHCFGAVNTTGTGPYTHTFTPSDLTGKALTIQFGRPDLSGTVRAFTYAGCKVSGWSLSANVGEIASMDLDIVAMSETTATALATASYDTSLEPFVFTEASLTVGGSALAVKSVEINGDNANSDERFKIGSGNAQEYLEQDFRSFTGSLVADFEDLTEYNYVVNSTENALVLTFDNGTESLVVTCAVRWDGETPALSGPELLEQPLQFTCTSTTSDAAAITAVLINGDASAA